jgi:hypothetical protein
MTAPDRMPNGRRRPALPVTVRHYIGSRHYTDGTVQPAPTWMVHDANGYAVAACRSAEDAAAYVRMAEGVTA